MLNIDELKIQIGEGEDAKVIDLAGILNAIINFVLDILKFEFNFDLNEGE